MNFVLKVFFGVCAFLFSPVLSYGSWDINDVSFLYPVSEGPSALLAPQDQGSLGPILPQEVYNQIPLLVVAIPKAEMLTKIKVVSLRIDPCFPGEPTPQKCERSVRLIWQPVEKSRRGMWIAHDAAFHSFYTLNDSEFFALVKELENLKNKYQIQTQGLPLWIHPGLAKADYREEFKLMLLNYIGEKNLTKITAMFLRGAGNMWAFVSYAKTASGKLEMQKIPRLDQATAQSFVNLALPEDHFRDSQIQPQPKGNDTFNLIMQDQANSLKDPKILWSEIESMVRIENPKLHNPDTMDCVSCHVAQPAKLWAFRKYPELKVQADLISYKNPAFNLNNEAKTSDNTLLIRAFGYDQENPAISQRVINESAEVAQALNLMFAK